MRVRYWFVLNVDTAEAAPCVASSKAEAILIVALRAFGYSLPLGPEWKASRMTVPQVSELGLTTRLWEGSGAVLTEAPADGPPVLP